MYLNNNEELIEDESINESDLRSFRNFNHEIKSNKKPQLKILSINTAPIRGRV